MGLDKDHSYSARKARQDAALITRIADINQESKLSGIIPRLLVRRGTTLEIRYTDSYKQRKIISPPGVDLTPSGILQAQTICLKITQALRLGNYSDEWLEREIYHTTEKPTILTCLRVRDEFSDRWLKYRSGDKTSTDRQKLRTLGYYQGYINQLYELGKVINTETFNSALITRLLAIYPEGSDKRFRARETLSVISSLFGITYNFKGIGKRPKAGKRELPTDSEILEMYEKFSNFKNNSNPEIRQYYKWVFAVLATYGLRPQEIHAIDRNKSFRQETSYWIFLDGSLCEGIKTGDRIVPPLHSEWLHLMKVTDIKERATDKTDVTNQVARLDDFFRRNSIGCKPYDLRHAYAVRGHRLGKPVSAMARAMGHDIATHVRIYQRWMSIEDQIESFNRVD
jgi:integrase